MIGHLRGVVSVRDRDAVVVDVHGVGYVVHVATSQQVPAVGDPIELFTTLHVREDALTLYGFAERTTLELFRLLLTSSGVGPRLALAALGTHRADVLRAAIAAGDLATLTDVPGVGRKVAERLVLELKDKVGVIDTIDAAGSTDREAPPIQAEVRDALVGLGYTVTEIGDALDAVATDETLDSAELLRRALRHLGRAREVAR